MVEPLVSQSECFITINIFKEWTHIQVSSYFFTMYMTQCEGEVSFLFPR
jgi:hypothetical protein